ncbi:DNA cytosine methyltransferase [Stenotrophomonas sp. HMWF003]|uniref:DNA cytosine methyltransferase n=1 Tax=Stenotrophomonas sp. HMWF003 TaxID=2056840 RepID=UPI000D483E15|nr:DNA cytosine methyltransferase [Stenotrophomonas sp. HMWF003]PTT63356.1 hypothetical protein DBR34_07045 [Stenotrophomonas sp. HMWF003]
MNPEFTQTQGVFPKPIRVAAFFAGAGGLDLGFDQAGFDVVYATDFVPQCAETLRVNSSSALRSAPEVVCADIRSLRKNDLPTDIDFVIGGPPCQSFSASGRRAGGAAGTLDSRGTLFEAYCRVLSWLKPKGFLFENVRGILATNGGEDWERIQEAFRELGYTISFRVLDALDYGAPQQRERLFLVGHRADQTFLFPEPLFGPDSSDGRPHITASEALEGIVNSEDIDALYLRDGKYSHLLPLVPPGSNYLHFTAKRGFPNPVFAYRSRFSDFLYKADPGLPVKTLIASPGKYTGPFHWDSRYFTVAEYKRLQGFPDEYEITGSRSDAIKQIGNSVSPKIAYILARAIAVQIFGADLPISLLPASASLSFDKRKSAKAKNTRQLHAKVDQTMTAMTQAFSLHEYTSRVEPTTTPIGRHNTKVIKTEDGIAISVRADGSRKLFAKMTIRLPGIVPPENAKSAPRDAFIHVELFGESPHSIQTMWNAIDEWVIKSSNFHSLFELYGHFTEPHPIFEILTFSVYSEHPIARFAQHCSDFSNCSVHLKKSHLTGIFGSSMGKRSFLDIVEILRNYRFDIRCFETNIAMPKDKYMVAYPFTLPLRKQMNFSVKRKESPLAVSFTTDKHLFDSIQDESDNESTITI